MGKLQGLYPDANFLITGAVGKDSNIHNPNESLNIDYCLKYT